MRMLVLAVSLITASSVHAESFSVNVPQLQDEAKQVIMKLAGTLGGELKKAKAKGGAEAAVKVCNTKAQDLTQLVANSSDWEISRTSLKLRNPDNAPDTWELNVLEQFEGKAKQGANLKTLGYSQIIVDGDGRKVFRMMKAIPVGDQCLACHGTKIKPELKERLDILYPNDRATGFSTGDLRGAFTLKKYL